MSIDTRRNSYNGKPEQPIGQVVYALRRSFFLTVFVFGLIVAAFGYVALDGILSGMFGIWGGTMIIIGGVAWLIILALRE